MANPLKNLSTPEKWAIGVGGLVVVWFAWQQHQSSSAAASSSSAIDPLTGLPASEDSTVDPATGETYLAEAQEYGSVAAAEQALTGTGISGYGTGGGSYYPEYGDTGVDNTNVVQGTTYGSNSAWAQAVEAGLTDIGYSSTDVSAAIGRYLGGLSETPAQQTIVQAALAEYGPPPVGSYTIIPAPATGPAGSGTGITGKQVQGLKVTRTSPATKGKKDGSAQIEWNQLAGATSYQVYMEAKGTFSTPRTIANEGDLPAGRHEVMVTPEPGGKGRSVSFTIGTRK